MGLATYLIYQQAWALSNAVQVILFQVRAGKAALRRLAYYILEGPEIAVTRCNVALPTEREFSSLSPLSIRRKGVQINLSILFILLLSILGTLLNYWAFNGVQESLAHDLTMLAQNDGVAAVSVDGVMDRTFQAISAGRAWSMAIAALTVALTMFAAYRLITVGVRAVAIEVWIRRMGSGDLDYKVDLPGHDEINALAVDLEKLRQRSIEALQLNLVETLSRELQEKNDELERALSELRQTQDQIIQRQKLAELGELTAGVAHEIRNPMNFIKNFSESSEDLLGELKETLGEILDDVDGEKRGGIDEISDSLVDNLQRIRSHTDRVNRIVRDMLMIGRGGGSFQWTNINDLLRDRALLAFHSARAAADDFLLDIKDEFDPNAGEVSMVPEDMGRVFLNIVSNACDATDEKRRAFEDGPGSFMPTLWLKTERKENIVEVRIRDNGSGIPPDVVEKIFNPFFTTKPTGKGTGLGLSMSNDIVREHGGAITAQSTSGEYTEMIVTIPVSRDAGISDE